MAELCAKRRRRDPSEVIPARGGTLAHRAPCPASRSHRNLLAIALGLVALQLVPFLDTLPGLHGDEAWAGLRAHGVLDGQISVYGLTAYTGPVHQLLLVPVLETLGYHVWALRSLTVFASLLSVWLFFGVVRRVFDAQLAGIAALVLASMPWFVLYGRSATEHFALNPVLALAATRCLLAATDTRGRKRDALPASEASCWRSVPGIT